MKTFIIPGEVPGKKNSNKFNSKTKVVYKDKRFSAWHDMATMMFRVQKQGFSASSDQIEVDFVFFHENLIRRDSDNGVTSLFDTMKDVGIITDDNWKIIPTHVSDNFLCKTYGVDPQVVIMIKPYNPAKTHLEEALEVIRSRNTSQVSK